MQLCNSASTAQLAVLFLSLGLISIGASCVKPCSIAFGANQLTIKDRSNDERLLDSYFNWYYASIGISTMISLSVIVYIQENVGWKIGFGVPAVLMFISAVSFILGSPFDAKVKPGHSLLTSFVQVIVVAIKNKKLSLIHYMVIIKIAMFLIVVKYGLNHVTYLIEHVVFCFIITL